MLIAADLEELRAVVVVAGEQQRDAKRADAAALRELLHDRRELAHEHRDGDRLAVHPVVLLRRLAPLPHEHAKVGPHARVDDRDVLRQHEDLLHGGLVDEDRGKLLLGRDDDAILGCEGRVGVRGRAKGMARVLLRTFDTKRRRAAGDGVERIFNLHELARRREGGEGERIC